MGNNSFNVPSSSPNNFVQIQLKSFICLPGQAIEGNLLLKSSKQLKFGKVLFQVKQVEWWLIHKTKKTATNQTQVSTVILEYPHLINMNLTNGISIPFSFVVPNYVLPSFEYSLYDKQGNIRNQLFVNIDELQLNTYVFIVIQKPPSSLNSPLTVSSKEDSKVLGLVDKVLKKPNDKASGVELEVSYQKDNYAFFDTIPVNIKLESAGSKLAVKKVECELRRRIKFLVYSKDEKALTWDETVYKQDLPVTTPNQTFNVQVTVAENDKMYNRYVMNQTHLTFPDKRQIITCLPSVSSSMFLCEYFIHVVAVYDQLIPVFKNVVVDLPLVISHYSTSANGNEMMMNANLQQINQQFNQGLNQIYGVNSAVYPMQQQMPMQMGQMPGMPQQQQMPMQMNNNMPQQQFINYPTEEQITNQGNSSGVPPNAGGYPTF